MLKLTDFSASYGQSTVIDKLNLEIKKGEIVALLGRNGMGKTTLMKSIMGLIKHNSGSLTLDGHNLMGLKSYERVAAGLGYVPQGRMIFNTLTVTENITTGMIVSKTAEVPPYVYRIFPILKEFAKRKGGNLSGGQQQQLAIARALVTKPKMLILDEPTEGIQPSIISEMSDILRQIRDEFGLTIFVSEQVLSFALSVADRILVIEKGQIVYDSPASQADGSKIETYLSV